MSSHFVYGFCGSDVERSFFISFSKDFSDTESLPESNTVDDGFEDFASQLEKELLPTFLSPIRDIKKEKGDSAIPLETKLLPTSLSPIRDRKGDKEDEDAFACRLEQEFLPPFLSPIRDQRKKNIKTCKRKSDVQQTHSGLTRMHHLK